MKEKKKPGQKKRTCFISASADTPISKLTSVLRSLGVRPVIASDFSQAGTKPSDLIADAISRSDLVIGVLSESSSNANVLFELGYAHALKKPLLIQAGEGAKDIPSDLRGFLYVRTSENESSEALRFAVQQWISAPSTAKRHRSVPEKKSKAIGRKADDLLQRLDRLTPRHDYLALQAVVQDALRATGISAYAHSEAPDHGVDLAVWVDDVESLLGNPILIEVKAALLSVEAAYDVRDKMLGYLATTNSRTGVILYLNGPASPILNKTAGLPNLFFLEIRNLLEQLRTRGFGTVVAHVRNRVVHGGTY